MVGDWRTKRALLFRDDNDRLRSLNQLDEGVASESGRSYFRVWVDGLREQQLSKRGSLEDISFRHATEPLGPAVVFGVLCEDLKVDQEEFRKRRRGSPLRAVAAAYLTQYALLNQREVAKLFDAGSGEAISKQPSRFADQEPKGRDLIRKMKKIDVALTGLRRVQ
jgi:3'-phosphoadenosine 5'-phosphosulfate sulfotransferase (PAPS reductase)/FAD synthetase